MKKAKKYIFCLLIVSLTTSCSSLVGMLASQVTDMLSPSYRLSLDALISTHQCLMEYKKLRVFDSPTSFEFNLELQDGKYFASSSTLMSSPTKNREKYELCLAEGISKANLHSFVTDTERYHIERIKKDLSLTSFRVFAEILTEKKGKIRMISTNDGKRKPIIINTNIEDDRRIQSVIEDSYTTTNEIHNTQLSNAKNEAWTKCHVSSDCVLITGFCSQAAAVHKDFSSEARTYLQGLTSDCRHIQKPIWPDGVTCTKNQCEVTFDKAKSK